jgi:hypothetical protein
MFYLRKIKKSSYNPPLAAFGRYSSTFLGIIKALEL